MDTDLKELRVKPFIPPPEKKKLSFHLPEPTVTTFNKYLEAYAALYGIKADADFVANQIFTYFFETDKTFMAFQKENADKAESARKEERQRQQRQEPERCGTPSVQED